MSHCDLYSKLIVLSDSFGVLLTLSLFSSKLSNESTFNHLFKASSVFWELITIIS